MSLDDFEGFDEWGVNTAAPVYGWSANLASLQAGRFGGFCARWQNNGTTTRALPVANARQTIGFAWRTTNAAQAHVLMEFREGGTVHGRIAYNGNGTFTVSRAGTTVGANPTTPNLGIASNTWYYIELDYLCADGTGGAYEMRVNEVNVANGTGVDTRNGGTGVMDTLAVIQPNGTATDWDDTYYASGSTSFQGDCRVITDMPNSDGSYTGWTPSTGVNHWAVVDEIPANADTDYLSATTTVRDTFGFASLGVTGTVLAVAVQAVARKDDAGTRDLQLVVVSGGNTYDSASTALGASYVPIRRIDLVDPDTSAPWTVSDVNAGQYGVRNV